MGKTTYHVSTSIDGFVATEDDSLTWLYEIDRGERDVVTPFLARIGALVMGAATYECIVRDDQLLDHPERWRQVHADRPAWVFTHRELPAVPGADITFVDGDVRGAYEQIRRRVADRDVWIAGGGGLAAAFADAGLLDELVVAVAPVLLGRGKPLFTGRLTSERLSLTAVEQVGQLVHLTYQVRNDR